MNLIHFIHVCQGFAIRKTYFGTTGVCQRIKQNSRQLQNFPENSLYPDCSLLRSKHTHLFSGSYKISVKWVWCLKRQMRFRFPAHFPNIWDLICHTLHCLASTQSLRLPSSHLLCSVCTVCMYECIYTRALARCALRPVVYSSWWKRRCLLLVKADIRRPTPLYRCE